MSYEELKTLVSEHKARLATVAACAVMFVVGFGTGHATKPEAAPNEQSDYIDYTSKPEEKPAPTNNVPLADEKQITPPSAGKAYDPSQPCVIKGNVSGSSKIFHVKGGSSYEKTVPEQCFNTEAEAVAAGFRKAKR
jgi:hypothetical protein